MLKFCASLVSFVLFLVGIGWIQKARRRLFDLEDQIVCKEFWEEQQGSLEFFAHGGVELMGSGAFFFLGCKQSGFEPLFFFLVFL